MNVWIARQPIFDRKVHLFAYELLFRLAPDRDHFEAAEAASATTQVIAHSLLGIGLENVLAGHKAFVNFDRSLLLGSLHSMFPRKDIVLEILEDVEADPEVLDACRSLRQDGYTIALDDFVQRPETEPLIEFAQIIKVDVQATPRKEQERILNAYKPRGIALLAEKVETNEEFTWALNAGYEYFQGYFFARPALVPGRQIAPVKVSCLCLLSETQSEEPDLERIERVISGDVSLTWQLLRYVNSPLFYSLGGIRSIRQALAIAGEVNVRRWAALATLSTLAQDKPTELLSLALVRGHFREYLARLTNIALSSDSFLMGLFSLIDALIDLPMGEALNCANVAPAIQAALLGTAPGNDSLQAIHSLASAWESGEWESVARLAEAAGIPADAIGEAYTESTLWAQKAVQGTARRAHSRRCTRRECDGRLKLSWADEQNTQQITEGMLFDISAAGLGFHANESIPLHSAISFDAPGLGISGKGSVRHCNPAGAGNAIGIERAEYSV